MTNEPKRHAFHRADSGGDVCRWCGEPFEPGHLDDYTERDEQAYAATKQAEAREWRRSEGTSAPATDTDTDWVLFVGGKAYDGAWLPEGLEAAILATEREATAALVAAAHEAVGIAYWMSGSSDFGVDGIAREGWVKARARLNEIEAVLNEALRPFQEQVL